VSTISSWEVAMLLAKGRLQMAISAREWVRRSEALGLLEFVPVSNTIALRSVDIQMHPDPADRIIVATAMELGLELITKDEKLHGLGLPTLW
jgi:PIN domain nuclease of toxin-antitoxin system